MIQLSVLKKYHEKLTCKEAAGMVIPYIEGLLCDRELRSFVKHVKECRDCREELETYYIVYKGLMQLEKNEELPMNIVEALNGDLHGTEQHLKNMSLFYMLSELVKWLVNILSTLLMAEIIRNWIMGV